MTDTATVHIIRDAASVSKLITLLYDAAIAPERWNAFFEELAKALELRAVYVAVTDNAGPQEGHAHARRIPMSWGLDPAEIKAFEAPFAHINARQLRIAANTNRIEAGTGMSAPRSEFVRSEFFDDTYAPAGMQPSFGAVIHDSGPLNGALVCHRSIGRPGPSEDDVELLELLVPHMRIAYDLMSRLGTLLGQQQTGVDLLDRLPVGVIFVGEGGTVAYANPRAKSILREEDGLMLRNERLSCERAGETQALIETIAVATAAARDTLHCEGANVRLPRPSGRRALDVTACPVDPANQRWRDVPTVAFIVVSDGEVKLDGVAQRMMDLYGLSTVESELAVAIASGLTVREWADRRDVSVETVRWQLKQVFAKTETSRQPELMRLVLLGPGLLL